MRQRQPVRTAAGWPVQEARLEGVKRCWHMKKAAEPRRPLENPRACGRLSLRVSDVLGLQTLGAALYLELNFASLLQRLVSVHLDRREVDKYVFAIGSLDE